MNGVPLCTANKSCLDGSKFNPQNVLCPNFLTSQYIFSGRQHVSLSFISPPVDQFISWGATAPRPPACNPYAQVLIPILALKAIVENPNGSVETC